MIPTFITNSKGEVMLNDVARHVKGCILVPASSQQPIVVAAASGAGAPGVSPPVIFEGPTDAVAEIYSLIGAHASSDLTAVRNLFTVEITETMFRRRLMNRAIPVPHVFGTNLNPFFLPESLLLENQGTLQFTFTNNSTAGSANFYSSLEARKFQQVSLLRKDISEYIYEQRSRKQQLAPYWLTSDQAITLPAGGKATAFFTATKDITLALFSAMAYATTTGVAGDTTEQFTVSFFDAESERPLQNQPVAKNCVAGTAQYPYVLPSALILRPNTKMRAEFTNLITDQPTNVYFTFGGVALYEAQIPQANHPALPSPAQRGS